jgi:hypothetical protein
MKISELTTDEAAYTLCELVPYVNNIVVDENLVNALSDKINSEGAKTKAEVMLFGAEKINKLMPIIFKTHKEDVFGILAVLRSCTVEEIAKQNVIKTAIQIKEIINDKELVSFFKSCARTDAGG